MADLAQTPANVRFGTNAKTLDGVAGEAFNIGQPVYLDPTTGKYFKTDANLSIIAAACAGLAATTANAADQPCRVCWWDDDCTHGLAASASGDVLVVSANAGMIAPSADLAAGWFPTVIGIGKSATKMLLDITKGLAVK